MKKVLPLLLLVAIAISGFFIVLQNKEIVLPLASQPEQSVLPPRLQEQANRVIDEDIPSHTPKQLATTQQATLSREEILKSIGHAIDEEKEKGTIIDTPPKKGMIGKKLALEKSKRILPVSESCDPGAPLRVQLVKDAYVVTYWGYRDPFYSYERNPIVKVSIDAWTGKHIGTLKLGDRIFSTSMSRKTGGDGSEAAMEACHKRLGEKLFKLFQRSCTGKPLESNRKPDTIEVVKAVETAQAQVKDRDYDLEKEPWPLLVDDLYIVTFWKKTEDVSPEGGKLFDARVGIDARTGEFIAMDVARKTR